MATMRRTELPRRPARGGVLNLFLFGGLGFVGLGAYLLLRGSAEPGAPLTFLLLGGIWVLVAMGVRGFYLGMHRRAEAERELFETGRKATAVVEEVRTTGMVLNDVNQQIVLRLRVKPAGRPEFEHTRKMFVPFHGMPRPGDEIEVAYQPGDTNRVALATDWSSDTAGGRLLVLRRPGEGERTSTAPTAADRKLERLAELDRLRQSGTLTFSEFESLKAQILSDGGSG